MSDFEYDKLKYNNQSSETRYIRKDVSGGYLYNLDEISNYRLKQASEVVENLMLGDYNSEGYYIVNDDIVQELIDMPKLYIEGYNNSIFCVSEDRILKFGKINFAVVYKERNEGKEIEAQLQLLERIIKANGYYENTNTITISKYICPNASNFVELSMKAFNIYRNNDEMPAFIENEMESVFSVQNILNRKNYLDALMKYVKKQRSRIEKESFLEKLSVLKKSDRGREILYSFDKEFIKLKPYFMTDKENYYSAVNDLLDRMISKNYDRIKNDKYTIDDLMRIDLNKNKSQSVLFDKGRVELLKENDNIKDEIIKQQATFDSNGQPKVVTIEKKATAVKVETKPQKENESQEQIGARSSQTVNKVITEQYTMPKPTQNQDKPIINKDLTKKENVDFDVEYVRNNNRESSNHTQTVEHTTNEKTERTIDTQSSAKVFNINDISKQKEKQFDIRSVKKEFDNLDNLNNQTARKGATLNAEDLSENLSF